MKAPVVLACDHETTLDPEPNINDLVWCQRCRGYRLVTGLTRASAKCRNCSFSRMYPKDDLDLAKDAALRHVEQKRHHDHTVYVSCRNSTIVISSLPTQSNSAVDSTAES